MDQGYRPVRSNEHRKQHRKETGTPMRDGARHRKGTLNMAKKLKELAQAAKSDNQLVQTVRDSAQQIWLAGLGAFAKAQEEGGKVFDALVKEGETLHQKTRGLAEGRVAEVTGNVSKKAAEFSGRAQSAATETWDKLEQVFEDRVSRSLKRLGVPTAREVESLSRRVDELSAKLAGKAAAPRKAAAAKKAPARKAPAKKPAAKKAAK
jgi:poly(hydroxyalkanoate) granule-associated protein